MNGRFKINAIKIALCLAYPALGSSALAAVEPFPPFPVTLSTAVTPNIVLLMDTSGSMDWCPESQGGPDCSYKDANGKTKTGVKKIDSAKIVAKKLINDHVTNGVSALRWGLFSFDGTGTGAIKRQDVSLDTTAVTGAIGLARSESGGPTKLSAKGNTPLAEALLEVGNYWAGEASYYNKNNSSNYVSPIEYRCQKNFNIFVTDGESTADDDLPGMSTQECTKEDWVRKGKKWVWGCVEYKTTTTPKISYHSWNSAGTDLSLSFGICTDTTAVNGNILCPDKLEGSKNTSDQFDDGNSPWVRAVRDVSAYLFDKDMKYNGSSTAIDGDKKSWDDPKFRKQNVITYTIGFDLPPTASTNGSDGPTVMGAAATVGGGAFYTATDEASLSTALNTVVNSIVNSISNAGGVATTNPAKVAGNKLFQPVFNPDGWYGELRCYDYDKVKFDTEGNITDGACSVPKALIPAADNRNIWSSTWAPGNVSFQFKTDNVAKMNGGSGSPSGKQLTDLGATATDQNNVINYVRGVDGGNRVRINGLLGDITDSQPLVVTKPSGVTSEDTYAAFKDTNANRNMVFIGANDGMLHAFDVASMSELMGYVPAAVYPHLAALPSKTYGAAGGTAHVFGVNGELRQADVKIGSTPAWKTIVVSGLAQGGQGFFAIDATSDTQYINKTTPLKWEWNDQNDAEMGYTFGAPLIYNVRKSDKTVEPAVILVNGYENDYDDTAVGGTRKTENATVCSRTVGTVTKNCNTSALYIVNADTGALIKKFVLDGVATGVGGLSSPAGVDFGQDGVLDYVYAGDLNGKLWRFDLTDDGKYEKSPKLIFDAGPTQPITLRPAIKAVNASSNGGSIGNLIYFGTGKLLTDADRNTTDQQTFYAVLDDMTAPTTSAAVVLTDLLQREFDATEVTASSGRAGDYRKVKPLADGVVFDLTALDSDPAKNTGKKKGWYINLPTSSERLVSSPMLVNYEVLFGTGIPAASEKCIPGGKGWVMGLDPLTGGVVVSGAAKKPFSFIDMNGDGQSTTADKLSGFATGEDYVSGFSTSGIPTELTYVANSSKIVTIESAGDKNLASAGNVIALQDANVMAVYTGNAAPNTSKGEAMGRPAPDGQGGEIIACKIGSAGCDKATELPPPVDPIKRYKIETTIWREIK